MTYAAQAPSAMSRVRWTVCALLFFATTVNYVDRQVLSLLAKTLETSIGWNSQAYGYITAAFQATYAIGMLGAGRFIDWLGTRKGYSIAVGLWSLAAVAHAAAASAFAFGVARAALGIGESANFPACIKTVAEWFPKKDRALAAGIFNSGANIGAIVAPLTVPWLALHYGWQSAFMATGALGFIWILFWLLLYDKPSKRRGVSAGELALIQSDPPDRVASVPWVRLFPRRGTWAYGIGKFLTDPVWWFFLFWLPKYLQETFSLPLKGIILPTIVVYNISTVGSIGGGWISSGLIKRGWTVNASRKTAMLICALAVVPVLYAPFCKNLWGVVALVGIAMAAHQGWSANLYTIVSDVFPRTAVGSVIGIGGAMGAAGGVLMQIIAGKVVHAGEVLQNGKLVVQVHTYLPLFLFSGVAYVAALIVIQSMTPKLAAEAVEG
jgi:ACS family hexuronate transporter-like MFS transporter